MIVDWIVFHTPMRLWKRLPLPVREAWADSKVRRLVDGAR